ncbi:MAG: outer membrane beta-barrel protein [Bacteroidota bacterium]|nr:outer membrane beta-barrel protein [Bacteroidota bacterium]
MKKILTSIAVVLFVAQMVSAQSFSFGAKVVPIFGWSNVTDTDTFNFTNDGIKSGIGIGPALKINMGDNFNTEVGVLFTWQGSKFSQTKDTLFSYGYDIKRQYMQIPVSFNASFDVASSTRVVMSFGGTPAIQLSSVADISDNNDDTSLQTDFDIPGTFFNLYLMAGLGASIELTDGVKFVPVVKYNHGVIDSWYDGDDNAYVKYLTEKNHFISLDLGLFIDF